MALVLRRRQGRKAARLARLLVALDAAACEQRSWPLRPRPRLASVSAAGARRPA
jgi:hypothetical protein